MLTLYSRKTTKFAGLPLSACYLESLVISLRTTVNRAARAGGSRAAHLGFRAEGRGRLLASGLLSLRIAAQQLDTTLLTDLMLLHGSPVIG